MYRVIVKLRGSKDDTVKGPSMEKAEAEAELVKIRETLGTGVTPDVPWLAVMGADIVGAHVSENPRVFMG